MTTSIRDLLDEAVIQRPTTATAARHSVGVAAGVLNQLQHGAPWRNDWRPGRHTRTLTESLAQACAAVEAGNLTQHPGRPAQLLAITGDALATMCGPATPAADRWAAATSVADLVRRCTTIYTETGPTLPDQAVLAAHDHALTILLAGRHLEPPTGRCILDLPIPSTLPVPGEPLTQAAAAAAHIDYRLARRGNLALPTISVYQLRAVALAFTSAMTLAHTNLPATTTESADAWRTVHQLTRRLVDGARPAGGAEHDLLFRYAIQLHQHTTQPVNELPTARLAVLLDIADHATSTAASLIEHTHELAGAVYTHAHQFPVPDTRAADHLRRQPIIIDQTDITVLGQALREAALTSGQLAGTAIDSWDLGDYPQLQRIEPIPAYRQPPSPSI